MIPEGWTKNPIKNILLEDTTGFWGNPPNGKGDVPVLRSTNLRDNGTLDYSKIAYRSFPEEKIVQKTLSKNDILLERSGGGPNTPVGRIAYFDGEGTYCFNNFMQRLRPDLKVCNGKFLAYSLWAFHAQGKTSLIQQATTGIRNLNYKEYLAWPILVPPLPEQKKIAAILSSVDDAIQATQAVIDQTRRVKQGLLQQFLTRGIGHTRFKQTEIGDIPEEWDVRQIGKLFKQVREPVSVEKESHYQEIGIRSHGKGIFHKDKITGEKLGNKRVFWIEPNCLILNIVFAWERAVALTNNQEKGMIASHRFPMFKPDEARILLPFIVLYFHSLKGMHALGSISPGGAGRNKTLSQKAFLKLPIPVPPLTEQTRIAEAISKIDNALGMGQQKLESLNRTKRGLMQDLLTGRVRVKPDEVNTT